MVSAKLISFILQAVLVVIAVLVFSYIDPFNIFNSKKLNMKDTPTIVSSIQSIGKLITAEYYGEVIQSTGEALELSEETEKNEERERLKNALGSVREALADLKDSLENLKNKRKVYRAFRKLHPEIMSDPDYRVLLTLVKQWCKMNEREFLEYYYEDYERNLDDELKNQSIKTFDGVIKDYVDNKFKKTNAEDRRIANNSLVLLGRGWVKVGFDFSHFDEDHFDYFPDRNLIRLKYHQPQIISATINPWFIPQRKIKGFEYLYVGKTIAKNPDKESAVKIIQDLKQNCLDNLINDARDAGIMETAIEQAEASLSQLFSLLLDKDITVRIYADPMQAILSDILNDKMITPREIQSADSLVNRYSEEMPVQTHLFVRTINDSLKSWKIRYSPWADAQENWEIMAFYYLVASDKFCTSTERDSVDRYCKAASSENLSFKDYLYYAIQHKDVDSLFERNSSRISGIPDDIKTKIKNSKSKNLDSLREAVLQLRRYLRLSEIINSDTVISNLLRKDKIREAYSLFGEAEKCLDEPEPWKDLHYDWNMLAIYRQIQDTVNTAPAKARELVSKIPAAPGYNEYFYFMYLEGHFRNFQSGESLLKKFKNPPAQPFAGQEREIQQRVFSIHRQNKLELERLLAK